MSATKKPIKNNDHNSNFILDENEQPLLIDHALGFIEINGEKLRYVGIRLFENVTKYNKKEQTYYSVKEKNSTILLENGQLISKNNTKKEFNFASESKLKNDRLSLEGIKKIIAGEYQNITFKEVFESFRKHFQHAMVYEFEEWYDLLAIWCMCTYFQDLTNQSLIIKVGGESGVAKSKTGKIVSGLAFNGKKFLCPTPANFFRYRHNNKATLFIEEAERLFDDSKKQQNGDSELIEYLNGSYEKGNTVPRQNDKNINETDEFDPYGWTMIGAIKPLRGALKKRSIELLQIKAKKGDPRAEVEVPVDSKEFQESRNKAYALSLHNYCEFQEKYAKKSASHGLSNRDWLVSKALIAMAECISTQLGGSIGAFLAKRFEVREEELSKDSWEFKLIEVILEITLEELEDKFIPTEDIREKFISKLDDQYQKVTPHKIAQILNQLGLKDFKHSDGEKRGYQISFFKACEIFIRSDKVTINYVLKKVSEVSKVSEKPEMIDKIEQWLIDTFPDTYTLMKDSSDTLTHFTLDMRGVRKKIEKYMQAHSNPPLSVLETNFGKTAVQEMIKQGLLIENPAGVVRLCL